MSFPEAAVGLLWLGAVSVHTIFSLNVDIGLKMMLLRGDQLRTFYQTSA